MIIGQSFPNDSLRTSDIQHDVHDVALSIILDKAKQHYRVTIITVGFETELLERVISLGCWVRCKVFGFT